MNNITDNNYNEWVDRFLNAETSMDEERALYAYFSQRHLPPEAEKYRRMFGWYDSIRQSDNKETNRKSYNPPIRVLPLKLWQWAGAAAVIAILITVGLSMRSHRYDDAYAYSGSYIIRDGEKITDLEIVLPEIELAERKIEMRLASLNNEFDSFDERFNTSMTSDLDMDNPNVRNIVETTLKY